MKKETFTTCNEAVDSYKKNVNIISAMTRNLIRWETNFFGGIDEFRLIAEKVTGLSMSHLSKLGVFNEKAPVEETYGQMTISWEGCLNWSFKSGETDRAMETLNTIIDNAIRTLGSEKWNEVQFEALGITLKQYITRYDELKSLNIKLGAAQAAEYEAEWLKNLKAVGEMKFSCKKFEFRRAFFEKLNIWNPNYTLADITGYDYDISDKNQELRDKYYEYAHERFMNDYWFDDQPNYLENKRKHYGIA